MNIAEITFDRETTTTIYGQVYGMSYLKEREDFSVEVFIDCINERIKVLAYSGPNVARMTDYLNYLAEKNGFGKVIMVAREEDWETLISRGYILEGLIKNYFRGQTGYCLSRFFTKERRISNYLEEEDVILNQVLAQPIRVSTKTLPAEYQLRTGTKKDIDQLVELFTSVFDTYPTPLNHPEYLAEVLGQKSIFKVIEYQGKIISAASGEINPHQLAVEITDCASLPEYRGQGLMSHLIQALEEEMHSRQMQTLYSLSRALSFGINLLFHRHGYTYSGRQVNNCDIMGKLEDMNLWVKHLPQNPGLLN